MKHMARYGSIALLLIMAACMPPRNQAEDAGKDKLGKQFDDSFTCVAFYDAYAVYLQPYYPPQAAQYAQYAAQNRTTTYIWLMSKAKASAPQASQPELIATAKQTYSQKMNWWAQFLRSSTPQAVQTQAEACNAYMPQINWGNAKLQSGPNYPALYNAIQQSGGM